jgi:hypothetical protein
MLPTKPGATGPLNRRTPERRKTRRYPIFAKAEFEWQDWNAKHRKDMGSTRDISARAAFICTHRAPALGVDVTVVVALPSLTGGSGTKATLCGRGRVVRIVPNEGFVVEATLRVCRVASPGLG